MNERLEQFRADFVRPKIITETGYLWLYEKGFFTAPASVRNHGNHVGGLFEHSSAVVEELEDMTDNLGLQWSRPESPRIVGMFHDLCKIDRYELNPDPASPDKFRYTDPIIKGHGEKSVMLASQLLTLTEEEMYCIRFHMGAFSGDDIPFYSRAVEKYPNVLYTHTADMIASHIHGK